MREASLDTRTDGLAERLWARHGRLLQATAAGRLEGLGQRTYRFAAGRLPLLEHVAARWPIPGLWGGEAAGDRPFAAPLPLLSWPPFGAGGRPVAGHEKAEVKEKGRGPKRSEWTQSGEVARAAPVDRRNPDLTAPPSISDTKSSRPGHPPDSGGRGAARSRHARPRTAETGTAKATSAQTRSAPAPVQSGSATPRPVQREAKAGVKPPAAAADSGAPAGSIPIGGASAVAPKAPHVAPRARRVTEPGAGRGPDSGSRFAGDTVAGRGTDKPRGHVVTTGVDAEKPPRVAHGDATLPLMVGAEPSRPASLPGGEHPTRSPGPPMPTVHGDDPETPTRVPYGGVAQSPTGSVGPLRPTPRPSDQHPPPFPGLPLPSNHGNASGDGEAPRALPAGPRDTPDAGATGRPGHRTATVQRTPARPARHTMPPLVLRTRRTSEPTPGSASETDSRSVEDVVRSATVSATGARTGSTPQAAAPGKRDMPSRLPSAGTTLRAAEKVAAGSWADSDGHPDGRSSTDAVAARPRPVDAPPTVRSPSELILRSADAEKPPRAARTATQRLGRRGEARRRGLEGSPPGGGGSETPPGATSAGMSGRAPASRRAMPVQRSSGEGRRPAPPSMPSLAAAQAWRAGGRRPAPEVPALGPADSGVPARVSSSAVASRRSVTGPAAPGRRSSGNGHPATPLATPSSNAGREGGDTPLPLVAPPPGSTVAIQRSAVERHPVPAAPGAGGRPAPRAAAAAPATRDVARHVEPGAPAEDRGVLAEEVYRLIRRRLEVERERRGLGR